MPNGDSELAQGVYAAQLFAARGTCDCTACQLLRSVADRMAAQILKGTPGGGVPGTNISTGDVLKGLVSPGT